MRKYNEDFALAVVINEQHLKKVTSQLEDATKKLKGKSLKLNSKLRRYKEISTGSLKPIFSGTMKTLQEATVDDMQHKLKRPAASTGNLKKRTESQQNIEVDNLGAGVGDSKWLKEKGVAPHAMAIEKGLVRGFVGRHLTGYWTEPGTSFPGHGFNRHRTHETFHFIGDDDLARSFIIDNLPSGGIINRPIKPHNNYKKAWKNVNPQKTIIRDVIRLLRG